MSITELGSLGELVASIAVLVTLVFLVFQMRQNTKTMQIATSTAVIQNWVQISRDITQDNDLADIWSRVVGMSADAAVALTEKEQQKLSYWVNSSMRTIEVAYLHWLDGHLDHRIWEGHLKTFRIWMGYPIVQHMWDGGNRDLCSEEFRDFVDRLIAEQATDAPS